MSTKTKQSQKQKIKANLQTKKFKLSSEKPSRFLASSSWQQRFWHLYPSIPNDNFSIITFQNTGQQPRFSSQWKSVQTAKAFEISKASVTFYTKCSLNEAKIEFNENFDNIMCQISSNLYSILNNNRYSGRNAP